MENFLDAFTSEVIFRLAIGLASVVVAIVLPILANQVRYYLLELRAKVEAELGSERFHLVWGYAETMVRAAEQQTGLDTNAKKNAFVDKVVYEFAQAHGWPLTHEQVDDFVEGVFNAIKPSLKAPPEPAVINVS